MILKQKIFKNMLEFLPPSPLTLNEIWSLWGFILNIFCSKLPKMDQRDCPYSRQMIGLLSKTTNIQNFRTYHNIHLYCIKHGHTWSYKWPIMTCLGLFETRVEIIIGPSVAVQAVLCSRETQWPLFLLLFWSERRCAGGALQQGNAVTSIFIREYNRALPGI